MNNIGKLTTSSRFNYLQHPYTFVSRIINGYMCTATCTYKRINDEPI